MSEQLKLIESEKKLPKIMYVGTEHVTPNEYIAAPAPSRALKESIAKFGVVQSIVVSLNGSDDPWDYDIVAGRRRLMACRELGIPEIPAIIFEDSHDAEYFARMSISENAARSPNIMSDMWSIKAIRDKRPGIDISTSKGVAEIAQLAGLTYAATKERLKLFNVPKEIIEATFSGRFPASKLETVSKLSKKARDGLAARLVAGEKLTGKDVSDAKANQTAERLAMQPLLPMAFEEPDEYSFYGTFDNDGEIVVTLNGERWLYISKDFWTVYNHNTPILMANLLAMIADGEDRDTILEYVTTEMSGVCGICEIQ